MSCKPNIYVATTNPTTVAANAIIPLSSIVRRHLGNINLSGNSVTINDCGSNYYLVSVNATFTAPAAGEVTLNLQQNSNNVTGATASTTITTATTETRSLAFTAVIRTFNNCGIDALSIVNTGVEAVFSNVTMTVVKL